MKKILSVLTALLCVSAVFTGCGKTDESDEKSSSGKNVEDELKDVVEDLIDAAVDKDMEKIFEYMMPDDLSDSMMNAVGEDLNGFIEEANDVSEDVTDAKVVSVKKTEEIDENTLIILEKVFSLAKTLTDYMEENDMSFEEFAEMDDEEIMETPLGKIIEAVESPIADVSSPEELVESGLLDAIESTYTVKEGCLAEITIEADGETESMEFPFYNIKGEGWNCEMILYPSMLGYVKKSKQASANSKASSLYKAANTALVDMDEQDLDVMGTFIISSDENQNYNLNSDFDTEIFKDTMKEYFYDIDELDYFMIINNGECSYVACQQKVEDSEKPVIGTYPISQMPAVVHAHSVETENLDEDLSFEDIYNESVKVIDNK